MSDKKYRMEDLGLESLVGRFIKSAWINEEKDFVMLHTETGFLYLTWEGSCCARCFIANVAGSNALVGSTIHSAENAEWVDHTKDEEEYEVIESMGTTIKTSKGTITFETRLEHNGYYSGKILVSDDEPMDQYSSPRENWEEDKLVRLEDF